MKIVLKIHSPKTPIKTLKRIYKNLGRTRTSEPPIKNPREQRTGLHSGTSLLDPDERTDQLSGSHRPKITQ